MPMPPSKKALAAGAVAKDKPRTRFRLRPVFDRSQVDPVQTAAEPVNLDPPIVRAQGDELEWAVRPLVELAVAAGRTVVFERGPGAPGRLLRVGDADLVYQLARALPWPKHGH
jgi:hypothetical protein